MRIAHVDYVRTTGRPEVVVKIDRTNFYNKELPWIKDSSRWTMMNGTASGDVIGERLIPSLALSGMFRL